jgi:hypothetical protein
MAQFRHCCFLSVLFVCSVVSSLSGHPVPRKSHDRTIIVRITPTAIVVDYRLEVDDWTVVYVDLPALEDKVDLTKLKKPEEFYEAFTRCYAPILGKNLLVRLDGNELEFRCVQRSHRLVEHLQCDFRFVAECKLEQEKEHTLTFRETNYELESGMLRLSIGNRPEVLMTRKNEPDEALKSRPTSELKPGDDETLRKGSATFVVERTIERAGAELEPAGRGKAAPGQDAVPGSVERK